MALRCADLMDDAVLCCLSGAWCSDDAGVVATLSSFRYQVRSRFSLRILSASLVSVASLGAVEVITITCNVPSPLLRHRCAIAAIIAAIIAAPSPYHHCTIIAAPSLYTGQTDPVSL